jgi:hypothetical protein
VDLRAHQLPRPFCTLVEAAYFLDLTFNQVQGRWKNGTLPRALAQDGSLWMPSGKKLVRAAELYAVLDETGRELFEQWQRDELRIPMGASADGHRDVRVRLLELEELPEHGTLARYKRRCTCSKCRAARTAYGRGRRAG